MNDESVSVGTRGTAVVTGAAGFIGSHLSTALVRRGFHVAGIDCAVPPMADTDAAATINRPLNGATVTDSGRAAWHRMDVRDSHRLRDLFMRVRPSVVFHLAARTGVRASIADPSDYASVNVDGLASTLEAARAASCHHVVFTSSSSVYGDRADGPFSEDDPVDHPISPYAATKRAGELIGRMYAHTFGMRIAALRLFTVYGPAQRSDLAIARFMRLIAAGDEVPMYGDGSSSRDYTYIDDIINGMLTAYRLIATPLAPGSAGGLPNGGFFRTWNLGHSQPIALSGMIDAVAKVVGKPARIKRLPMQPGDVQHTWADLTRSQAELKYQPTMDFMEGLAQQWEWMSAAANVSTVAIPAADRRVAPSAK